MTGVYRVIITPRAGRDLEEIHEFISRTSPTRADAMIVSILDALETLRDFPFRQVLQHQNPRLRFQVRTLPVSPYRVFFRVVDDEFVVRVLHVRHGARRLPRRFDR